MNEASVTVLVPVYRGLDEVRACIESVLRHRARVAFDLLVIDDEAPEPEVTAYVESLGGRRGTAAAEIIVLRNRRNRGFVATVNRGLALAKGDVVILNADTVVTDGWLDRMHGAATDEPDVATVTPLTNFGSICTLPEPVIDAFDLATEHPRIDECATFVHRHGIGRRPSVITGVGFCMLMTRDALDACGTFDARTFGRGYGEEVDFCLRATRLGFRHLVEDRTFVYHRGAVSFGDERQEGLERGSALIRDRYPWFRPTLRAERQRDPLRASFTALELGLHARDERRPHVLHLLHSAPDALGGTEKHLAALIDALQPEFDFSVLYPTRSGFVLRTSWRSDGEVVHDEYLLPRGTRRIAKPADENAAAALQTALDMFHFDAVHIQNLIGHSVSPLAALESFAGNVICSVRDPFLACPSHALLYLGQEFCGMPEDLSYCETCLPETREQPLDYLVEFRDTVTAHLDAVDTWVFASQSAADLLARAYDVDPARRQVIPHGAILDLDRRRTDVDRALVHDEPLRVAFVGLGRAKKGLDTVNWLAEELARESIEVHHFGNLQELASAHVHLHGPYDNLLLPELLDQAGIQVVLLPGLVSETFGHVVTEAWIAGRPVIGAFYGALGERIRRTGAGWTLDPMDPPRTLELLRNLDQCRDELHRGSVAATRVPLESVTDTSARYAMLYTDEGARRDQ